MFWVPYFISFFLFEDGEMGRAKERTSVLQTCGDGNICRGPADGEGLAGRDGIFSAWIDPVLY